jgi:hypothetical protein
MFFVSAMREIESSDIHAGGYEFSSFFWTFNGWAHCADNFCAAHVVTLFHHY